MNERLPYEEQLPQQWNDLPLPDEDMAWVDMKRRLEDDDDDKVIAWWRRSCGAWGFILLVIAITGWYLLLHENWFTRSKKGSGISTTEQKERLAPQEKKPGVNNETREGGFPVNEKNEPGISITGDKVLLPIDTNNNGVIYTDSGYGSSQKKKLVLESNNRALTADRQPAIQITTTPGKTKKTKPAAISKLPVTKNPGINKSASSPVINGKQPVQPPSDSIASNILRATKSDSLKTKPVKQVRDSSALKSGSDSLKQPSVTPTVKTGASQDSAKKKSIYFSAGLAVNQQLPVMGQTLTSYNSLGRKGVLTDYIPSVYFRLNKNERWFVQSEFRYGAPQYTKEQVYAQKSVLDTVGTNNFTVTTSSTLKKTYYHQASLSFNHYLLPNWSLGTGFVWNKFSTAISEEDVNRRDNATLQDTQLSKTIVRVKNDSVSVFKKSYFQAVIETQYKWKRISIGARYAFGLQPYLEFRLPGGAQQQEKNKTILVFLRYQLWRSHKK